MKIYVASSWRNEYHYPVVDFVRSLGHEVYDYRDRGFSWTKVSSSPPHTWSIEEFRIILAHPEAKRCYARDYAALMEADLTILVLPSGNDAHLEAGFAARNRGLIIYAPSRELDPGLMYKLAHSICVNSSDLRISIASYEETV